MIELKTIIIINILILSLQFVNADFIINDDKISIDNEVLYDHHLHTKDSNSIFRKPETLDMNYWKYLIKDYDNNGYPDIVHSDIGMDGLFHFQMNHDSIWNSSKINAIKYIEAYVNLSGDKSLDFLNYTEEIQNFDLALSEANEERNVTNIYTLDTNDSIQDLIINDIDSDGDNDIIFGYHTGYVQVYQNHGNGNFDLDWDMGIPDRLKNSSLPNLFTREIEIGDITNDGLNDICTAMRTGSWNGPISAARYYNWNSHGNGTWTDISEGFPIGERVLSIELGDIDNDGDLDYGILTETKGYIFENIDGQKWISRRFPNYNRQLSDFIMEDIDMDGCQDILTIDSKWHPDDTFTGRVNISFGHGNFTWTTFNQFNTTFGPYEKPKLEDFDRDGDKDLIFESFGYLLFSENTISNINNISFVDTPLSTHFRSGYLTEFSWTMKDAYKICNRTEDLEFNMSISYTGPEGPFFHLKTVKGQWWSDLIIPDMPSNNVYFRINFSEYSTTSGPYAIHDSEGLGSLIELTDPEYDSFMIGGEEVDITLRTSKNLQTGSYPVYLEGGGNRSYLGNFYLRNGGNNSFKIRIPHGFHSTYSHLEVTIPWHGKQRNVDTVSRFQVIPRSMIPDHFDTGEHLVPAGYKTNITVPLLSINGTDISSDCDYEILGSSREISVYPYKDGMVNVTCSDVGTHNFTVGTSKYGRSTTANITVIAHPNLHSILLITPNSDPRVGTPVNILFRGLGPEAERLQIDDKNINWSVEGDCEYSIESGSIEIIPLSSGIIDVTAIADVGFGQVEENISINAGYTLQKARIIKDYDQIMNGTTQILNLRIQTYNNMAIYGYRTNWISNENAVIESNTSDSAVIRAVKEGIITITAVVNYYNEFIFSSIDLQATSAPGSILNEKDIVQEIGRRVDYELEILTSSGDPFGGNFFITSEILNPDIASISIEDNILTVIGDEEGETEVVLNLSTNEGISFESTFPVSIRSTPDCISVVDLPEYPRTGESFQVYITVFNYKEDRVNGYSLDVESNNSKIDIINFTHFTVTPEESGLDEITIKVEKYGLEIESKISFSIVAPVSEILHEMESFEVPVNTDTLLTLIIKDPEGTAIPWNDFQFNKHQDIKIDDANSSYVVNGSRTGTYQIFYTTNYFGRTLEGNFNVTFYKISVLSEIRLTFDENSRLVEVLCLDQNSDNITSLCSIQWTGDFEILNEYKIISRSENISVEVIHNATSLEDHIGTPVNENGEKKNNQGIILAIILIILILIAGVFVYIIIMKKRVNNQEDQKE